MRSWFYLLIIFVFFGSFAQAAAGTCGPAATTYGYQAGNFAGALCSSGNQSPSSVNFPTHGSSVTWNCNGVYPHETSVTCTASRQDLPRSQGVCGSAMTQYLPATTTFAGEFCAVPLQFTATSTFPAAGSSSSWTCPGQNGATSASCAADHQIQPSKLPGCGTAAKIYNLDAASFSGTFCATGTSIPASPAFPVAGKGAYWRCGNDVCVALHQAPALLNGSCGTAAKTYAPAAAAFTGTFCISGTQSTSNITFPAQGSTRYWTCNGQNGGANANCSAMHETTTPTNAACGSAARLYNITQEPTFGSDTLCAVGTPNPSSVSMPGAGYSVGWMCNSPNGGKNVGCNATALTQQMIVGLASYANTCGSAGIYPSDSNKFAGVFCADGVPSRYSIEFPGQASEYVASQTWTCSGNFFGTPKSVSCTATRDNYPRLRSTISSNGNTQEGYVELSLGFNKPPGFTPFCLSGAGLSGCNRYFFDVLRSQSATGPFESVGGTAILDGAGPINGLPVTFIDDTVVGGNTYYYRARLSFQSWTGTSWQYSAQSSDTLQIAATAAPKITFTYSIPTCGAATINTRPLPGWTYSAERADLLEGPYQHVGAVPLTDRGVAKIYYYKVIGTTPDGQRVESLPVAIDTRAWSLSPVSINWGPRGYGAGYPVPNYQIRRSTSISGPFEWIATAGQDSTEFVETGLPPGTYYYMVDAVIGTNPFNPLHYGQIVDTQGPITATAVAGGICIANTAAECGGKINVDWPDYAPAGPNSGGWDVSKRGHMINWHRGYLVYRAKNSIAPLDTSLFTPQPYGGGVFTNIPIKIGSYSLASVSRVFGQPTLEPPFENNYVDWSYSSNQANAITRSSNYADSGLDPAQQYTYVIVPVMTRDYGHPLGFGAYFTDSLGPMSGTSSDVCTALTCTNISGQTCRTGIGCGTGYEPGVGTCGSGNVCCKSIATDTCTLTPGQVCQSPSCSSGFLPATGTCSSGVCCAPDTTPGVPTVRIIPTDIDAAEPNNGAKILIERTGSTAAALIVNFSLADNATPGDDYSISIPSFFQITIPAGFANAEIAFSVIDDSLVEGTENILVALTDDVAYDLADPQNVTISIADNDDPGDIGPGSRNFVSIKIERIPPEASTYYASNPQPMGLKVIVEKKTDIVSSADFVVKQTKFGGDETVLAPTTYENGTVTFSTDTKEIILDPPLNSRDFSTGNYIYVALITDVRTSVPSLPEQIISDNAASTTITILTKTDIIPELPAQAAIFIVLLIVLMLTGTQKVGRTRK